MNTVVLTSLQIKQKINRIAFEILENNFEEKELYLIGIKGNGVELAKRLTTVLKTITKQELKTAFISINKQKPLSESIELSCNSKELENKAIILVDDVINSGKTMQYALVKLLERPSKKIKTVALVDRKHRRYPIRCDYVGLTLSTTLQERVEVELTATKDVAFLK